MKLGARRLRFVSVLNGYWRRVADLLGFQKSELEQNFIKSAGGCLHRRRIFWGRRKERIRASTVCHFASWKHLVFGCDGRVCWPSLAWDHYANHAGRCGVHRRLVVVAVAGCHCRHLWPPP